MLTHTVIVALTIDAIEKIFGRKIHRKEGRGDKVDWAAQHFGVSKPAIHKAWYSSQKARETHQSPINRIFRAAKNN